MVGPSGMMMAGKVAELGGKVLLLEKNKTLAKKLKITGGKRCNITNAEFDIRKFLENFPESKEFLYSPFSKFSAKDTFNFFEKKGLPLVIEARKRVFPKTQSANDVAHIMEKFIKINKVEIKTNTRVISLQKEAKKIKALKTAKKEIFYADNFAIATGGLAAPETGSTGDGFNILENLGHTIIKPKPNLVPLTTNEKWVHQLSGNSLSFMKISFIQNGKIKIKKLGKTLFTHFGISGSLILNLAFEVKQLLKNDKVNASIDMFPDTKENELDRKILNLFNKNKLIKNVLPEIIPNKFSELILSFDEIKLSEKIINSITKKERKCLVKKN